MSEPEASRPGPSTRLLSMRRQRAYLLESISQAADEIADIDKKIAILRSQELEFDLNQAAEKMKT